MKRFVCTAAFLLTAVCCLQAQTNLPQLGKAPIKEVINAMTLEEKVSVLVGKGMNLPGLPSNDAAGATNGPVVGQTKDKVPGAAGTTHTVDRFGITTLVLSDGPAGVRIEPKRPEQPGKTFYATGWPTGTLLASTWDTKLVNQVGVSFGNEIKEYGVDVILGPGMNIHRNPLGGRNFEYFSEDPFVSGMMGAAIVNGIQSNGVGTSIKHFVANDQETNRNSVNAIVSERALREIYLKPFEMTIKKAQPWTVMSSYNFLNGPFTSENPELLKTILREEWGFKGFVMTDWFGGKDAVAQMHAGNDMIMPGQGAQSKAIIEAVKAGKLSEKDVDENVERVLNIMLQSPSFKKYAYSDAPDLKAHAVLAREVAAQGIVLLKNENALPFSNKKVFLLGNGAYGLIAGGTGSGDVNKAYVVSLAEGLGSIDGALNEVYSSYIKDWDTKHPKKHFFEEFMNPTPAAPEYALTKELVDGAVAKNDMGIFVIARQAGEGKDRALPNDFNLSDVELNNLKLASAALHAAGKKLIVVLNVGGVVEVASWREYADAIVLAWQPGQEGGNAIADVITGKVNPSGKLATSFPMQYADVPSANNFPGKEFPEKATNSGFFGMKMIPAEVTYEEGVYVGYRYYNTFNKAVAYPFGYGLSYTHFAYSNLTLSSKTFNGKIIASVKITNTGKVAGKEVVQLYLSAPTHSLDKPSEELKGFAKTALLQPGASETIQFEINANALASFHTDKTAWIADAGNYQVRIGASSADIKTTAAFVVAKDILVEKVHKVMVPTVAIHELKK